MNPEEMTALAEKYERWSAKVDGKETPECMAREYRAIAGGLRLLAGQDTRPDRASGENK